MKTLNLKKIALLSASMLSLLLLGTTFLLGTQTLTTGQGKTVVLSVTPPFFVRSYGGKCLDFGPAPQGSGSPVFIYSCNGTAAQQVIVQEINDRHEVVLHAGNKVIGVNENRIITLAPQVTSGSTLATGTTVVAEAPLELQDVDRLLGYSGSQIFALDGDSIILARNHNFVVKIQNGLSADRTPLVLAQRHLADSEFWTFTPTDGSALKPTSGFVSVPGDRDHRTLAEQLVIAVHQATPGTVIEVGQGVSIDLEFERTLYIPPGVTIRGDRRGMLMGPELRTGCAFDETMLQVDGNDVRITGLRIHGPSRSTSKDACKAEGIYVPTDRYTGTVIDHNDISDWTTAAVFLEEKSTPKDCPAFDPSRPYDVLVVRNFIHHNEQQDAGYGVAVNYGAYPLVEGNTFVSNRHAIKGGAEVRTEYRAWYNLVLSDAPWQYDPTGTIPLWHSQDFDVHGIGDNGYGGSGGMYFEIAQNTFLGTDRENFELRGTPCQRVEFHNNVSRRDYFPVRVGRTADPLYPAIVNDVDASKVVVWNNQFGAGNPTSRFGVGDFDGDGRDDLFLATGAAWYYSPGGVAEWRYLNSQTDALGNLRFGDFDSDGRTDVFTMHGRDWVVSWGGRSNWEKINQSDPRLSDFVIGDFDGDHRADVFYADGQAWYVSYGGVTPFKLVDTSSFRIPDLRFGDFNGDGKTDIFSVANNAWSVTYGGTVNWSTLRSKLSDSVAGLIVADFNGDGRADIARSDCHFLGGCDWQVSYGGVSNWITLRSADDPLSQSAAIGRFAGNRGVDVLLWHDDYLDIATGGSGTPKRQSNQDMR